MYWHIDTDIVSLLVICAVYVYTLRLKTERDNTLQDRLFRSCIWTGMVVTVIDIAASVVMEVPVSGFVYHIFMTAYFVSIELLMLLWVVYSMSILYHDDEAKRRKLGIILYIPYLMYVAFVCINPWTGYLYTLGQGGSYTRGPLFPVVVLLFALYTLALIYMAIARRKHVPKDYPVLVILLIPIILSGAIALQLLMPGWLMIMPGYMICIVLSFLFLQGGMVRGERQRVFQLTELMERFASGFAISYISVDNHLSIEYLNDVYFAILEDDRESLTNRYREDRFAGIHPDDLNMMKSAMRDMEIRRVGHELTYRFITGTGKLKWILVHASVTPHPDGTATVYSTFTDLTNRMHLEQQLSDLVQAVPCGIAQYRWDGVSLTPLIVNQRFSEMLGEDAYEYLSKVQGLQYSHVHPDDLPYLQQASLIALEQTREIDISYRTLNSITEQYIWVRMRGKRVAQPDGTDYVYVTFYDVTQEHNTQQQLQESEQLLETAAEYAGLWYWRYDSQSDRAYLDGKYRAAFDFPPVVDNYPEAWIEQGFIGADHAELYRKSVARIKAGEKQIAFDAQIRMRDGLLHWARFCFTNLFDAEGSPTTAVCTAMLIDTEKELWAKYELERRRALADDENLLAHMVFNLTTGDIIEHTALKGEDQEAIGDMFAYSQKNARLLIDDEERREFIALNDKDALLERFRQGETEFRLDYRRNMPDGDARWVRSTLHLIRDPRNTDVLLFEYWYDIEEEKMLEMVYASIAADNYDFVARISGRTRAFTVHPNEAILHNMPPTSGPDADEVTMMLYEFCEREDEKEFAIRNSLVENIKLNLRQYGRFSFSYREKQPDGSIRHKKITQYYIDEQREMIIILREDVTEIIRKEAEKNEMLAGALDAANLASHAKSQFLSRVSHELRTPLNGIIGFLELAKDAQGRELTRYLANSDSAAKQLLSVINDVLDVSSIEAGKLKIANASFDFKHMLHTLTNLYMAQCDQKGLRYDTRMLTPVCEWLIGDQLRVNQILLNLLGNAVKFTSKGYVRLNVSQTEADEEKVFIRFEVEDTGVGMSEEFMDRLFKPFEQENELIAQKFGGSGLGLSIVNSLVGMMGGVVKVKSELGVGSTFTVELPFLRGAAEGEKEKLPDVSSLNVLAVDDEEAEREYLSIVLTRIGVRHSCVGSGAEALIALEEAYKKGDPYSVCIVDWRMPSLNGIEITRRIREKYGKHMIVIVVSAYEHNQADESAKAAGANLFITKPLFQSSLYDLFATLTGGRDARRARIDAKQSFAGKRVLLVEDNAMNRVVAEGLIRRMGIECLTAADGQIAVDDFLSREEGFYDAILMDIQMPNMDGFEATKRIRESGREDAKRISIIALTANAFNEDIARTLAGGMNAHVSKPIEVDRLASALAKAFDSKDE